MEIELFYFEACCNHALAEDRLKQTLQIGCITEGAPSVDLIRRYLTSMGNK